MRTRWRISRRRINGISIDDSHRQKRRGFQDTEEIQLHDCLSRISIVISDVDAPVVKTNMVIDDKLMEDALRLTGLITKREAVELGLRTLLRLEQQKKIRQFRGKLAWEDDIDTMRIEPLVIGMMSQEMIRERVSAIARGSYKPTLNEPKIWFTSMKSLAKVLSDGNRALLHTVLKTKPESISALAAITGRKTSNLSRVLRTLSDYGIVELRRERNQIRPVVKAAEFRIVAQ